MAGFELDRFVERGLPVVRVLGTFDGEAAEALRAELGREPRGDVVIDLGFARGLDEVAVAMLARLAIAGGDRRIAIRGLTTHQRRVLGYLGAALREVPAAGAGER